MENINVECQYINLTAYDSVPCLPMHWIRQRYESGPVKTIAGHFENRSLAFGVSTCLKYFSMCTVC